MDKDTPPRSHECLWSFCVQQTVSLYLTRVDTRFSYALAFIPVSLSSIDVCCMHHRLGAVYTNAADKQCLEACATCYLYTADDPTPSQLVVDMDDNLFANILNNSHHVLHKFLPNKTDHSYNLRSRRHSLSLTVKTDCNNFLNRHLLVVYSLSPLRPVNCLKLLKKNDDNELIRL